MLPSRWPNPSHSPRPHPTMEALEPRCLLSADGGATFAVAARVGAGHFGGAEVPSQAALAVTARNASGSGKVTARFVRSNQRTNGTVHAKPARRETAEDADGDRGDQPLKIDPPDSQPVVAAGAGVGAVRWGSARQPGSSDSSDSGDVVAFTHAAELLVVKLTASPPSGGANAAEDERTDQPEEAAVAPPPSDGSRGRPPGRSWVRPFYPQRLPRLGRRSEHSPAHPRRRSSPSLRRPCPAGSAARWWAAHAAEARVRRRRCRTPPVCRFTPSLE